MRNAVLAHLDIFHMALREFQSVVADWTDATLAEPLCADPATTRREVLVHVVACIYYPYLGWIQDKLRLPVVPQPATVIEIKSTQTMVGFTHLLEAAHAYADEALQYVTDDHLELVFPAYWGENYSIDQMLEHAACHFWRHARQLLRDDLAKGRAIEGRNLFGWPDAAGPAPASGL